jgi:hypothetical protein
MACVIVLCGAKDASSKKRKQDERKKLFHHHLLDSHDCAYPSTFHRRVRPSRHAAGHLNEESSSAFVPLTTTDENSLA